MNGHNQLIQTFMYTGIVLFLLSTSASAAHLPDTLAIEQANYAQFSTGYLNTFPLPLASEQKEEDFQSRPRLPAIERAALAITTLEKDTRNLRKQVTQHLQKYSTQTAPALWDGLELYANVYHRPEKTLARSLDRTCTCWGSIECINLLMSPSTNQQLIKQRQEIIQFFLDNPQTTNGLHQEFSRLHRHEDSLLSFLRPNDLLLSKPVQTSLKNLRGLGVLLPDRLAKNPAVLKFFTDIQGNRASQDRDAGIRSNVYGYAILAVLNALLIGTALTQRALPSKTRAGIALSGPLLTWLLINNNKNRARTTTANLNFNRYIRHRMKGVLYLLNLIQKTTNLVSLRTELYPLKALIPTHDKATNKELKELAALLTKSSLLSKDQNAPFDGYLLSAIAQVVEMKDKIFTGIKLLATIDVYIGLAKLYREHAHKKARFSFTNLIERTTPMIDLESFWYPAIGADSAVPNDIALNITPGYRKDVLLTGPNTAGKSSVLRGIMINLILSQVFGLSAAQKATITPFNTLNTYAHVTDNLALGKSLFQAEVDRVNNLLIAIAKGGKSFTTLDEIFTGTEPTPASGAAAAACLEMTEAENSIAVVASHFSELPELEEETNESIANQRVYVERLADGTIVRPFTLVNGVNTQQIALELMMHEEFSPELINTAHDVLLHPEKYAYIAQEGA